MVKTVYDLFGLYNQSNTNSGTYEILPEGYTEPIDVYCDMTTSGGGWIIGNENDFSSNANGWNISTITTCGYFGNIFNDLITNGSGINK